MKIGLGTHFNALVGAATLNQVRALGFRMVRIDAQQSDGPLTRTMIAETVAADLEPYVIVRDANQLRWVLPGTKVELRNEPDIEGPDAATYRAFLVDMAQGAIEYDLQLYAPAISNLNRRGFAYLRELGEMPATVHGSLHWYAHGSNPQTPHPGSSSREDEVNTWLGHIGGGQPWGVSESGFHTARRRRYTDWRKNLPLYDRWTDLDVVTYVEAEIAFWARMGAEFYLLFQLNDGPEDIPEHRFGIRSGVFHENGSIDWTWKPVAYVLGLSPFLRLAPQANKSP